MVLMELFGLEERELRESADGEKSAAAVLFGEMLWTL